MNDTELDASDSLRSRVSSPGMPNTYFTPSASRHSTKTSEALRSLIGPDASSGARAEDSAARDRRPAPRLRPRRGDRPAARIAREAARHEGRLVGEPVRLERVDDLGLERVVGAARHDGRAHGEPDREREHDRERHDADDQDHRSVLAAAEKVMAPPATSAPRTNIMIVTYDTVDTSPLATTAFTMASAP